MGVDCLVTVTHANTQRQKQKRSDETHPNEWPRAGAILTTEVVCKLRAKWITAHKRAAYTRRFRDVEAQRRRHAGVDYEVDTDLVDHKKLGADMDQIGNV